MLKNFNIKPPFFEVGPKAIIWGEEMLALANTVRNCCNWTNIIPYRKKEKI